MYYTAEDTRLLAACYNSAVISLGRSHLSMGVSYKDLQIAHVRWALATGDVALSRLHNTSLDASTPRLSLRDAVSSGTFAVLLAKLRHDVRNDPITRRQFAVFTTPSLLDHPVLYGMYTVWTESNQQNTWEYPRREGVLFAMNAANNAIHYEPPKSQLPFVVVLDDVRELLDVIAQQQARVTAYKNRVDGVEESVTQVVPEAGAGTRFERSVFSPVAHGSEGGSAPMARRRVITCSTCGTIKISGERCGVCGGIQRRRVS